MRRRTLIRKYWTLIRLWWLGLRRPARVGITTTLALLVLGSAMPIAAAVTADDEATVQETGATEDQESSAASSDPDGTADEAPPAEEPPVEEPVADDPPAEEPPAEQPPAEEPPAEEPPAEAPPAEEPPADDPPAETPPAEQPPAEEPPADEAPASDPPAEQPPADDPTNDPPAESPAPDPADEPSTDDTTPAEPPVDTSPEPGEADLEPAADPSAPGTDQTTADPAPTSAPATTTAETTTAPEASATQEPTAVEPVASEPEPVPPTKERADAPSETEEDSQDAALFGLLPNYIPTFTLDANLPAPAREAQISGSFAILLSHTSEAAGANWALVLGVLRARGQSGFDISGQELQDLAASLAGLNKNATPTQLQQRVALDDAHAEQALALARYHRAVGKRVLVLGLEDGRDVLEQRVLKHEEILLTEWGRADVAEGRIGVRTLVVLLYLAQRHDDVVVSSLVTGHRLYSRPGVISAHVYGQAVDVAALDGRSIYGNQGPGSITEQAVRDLLLLPVEAYPSQLISLHNMGGASFAMADHYDHIHVGF